MRTHVMMVPVAALMALAVTVPRHIELVSSSPAADTVLTSPPHELLLTFSADLASGVPRRCEAPAATR